MSRFSTTVAIAVALASVASPAPAGERVLLDRIAAVVESPDVPGSVPRVLTQGEIAAEARLVLVERGGPDGLTAPLDAGLLRSVLDQIIAETLVAREADRLQFAELEPSEVADARRRLTVRCGGEEALRTLQRSIDYDDATLAAVLGRRILVDKFIRSNFSGVLEMPDADLRALFAAGGHPFVGQSFDAVREAFRSFAVDRRLREEVARWVETLRERSRVRILR